MRSRLIAVLVAGILALAACSSDSGSGNATSDVDPAFKQLVENSTNGTTADGSTAVTPDPAQAAAERDINLPCLAAEINKRIGEGVYDQADVVVWMQGLGADGPVEEAANEILASGVCAN